MNFDDLWRADILTHTAQRRYDRWMAAFGSCLAVIVKAHLDTRYTPTVEQMKVFVAQAEAMANLADMATQPTRDEWEKRQIEALSK
jgi:hypothetical protein